MVKMKKDDSTEEKILAAARKVFTAKGMAGARMQDIADEAGINKALLHYYFRNKEQLFENIFKKLSQGFWQQISQVFDSEEALFKKIESFCSMYIEKVIHNPYIPLFIMHELNQRPVNFVKKMFNDNPPNPNRLVMQIQAEVKAGNIRPIAPQQLIMNMISMCVLPFIGKPMFMSVMNVDEKTFNDLMQKRKTEVPEFIINSIKK
ncbi:MAG: TetR/AcrR family transcriptional regulator [Chitinophagaceae bacterium]|nr:TetR/AcrR family transcriptional regulator [Chitinophagaceae bacterium]